MQKAKPDRRIGPNKSCGKRNKNEISISKQYYQFILKYNNLIGNFYFFLSNPLHISSSHPSKIIRKNLQNLNYSKNAHSFDGT